MKNLKLSMENLEEEDTEEFHAQQADKDLDVKRRLEFLREDNASLHEQLAMQRGLKEKYKLAAQKFEDEISDYVERIGRNFLLDTLKESQNVEQAGFDSKIDLASSQAQLIQEEFEKKFSNQNTQEACGKIKLIIEKQLVEMSETKADLHKKLLSYV